MPVRVKLATAVVVAAGISLVAMPLAGATGPTVPGPPLTDAAYSASTVVEGLVSPFDVGVAPNGQLYVGNNSETAQLVRYSPFGDDPTVLETLPTFDALYQASVDSSNLWYVDATSGSLYKANLDGTDPTSFSGDAISYALDGSGNIFVNEYHSIVAETTAGADATTILSGLAAVYNIAANGQGQVFVPDWGNDEIIRVNSDGTDPTTIASGGLYGQVAGIAADAEGDVFFTLQGQGTVYEMKSDGTDLHEIAQGLNAPFGITATPSGDLFIGVRGSGTVLELSPTNRVAGFGSATISWRPPSSDGGSPVQRYEVVATGSDGSSVSSSFPAGTTTGTVYGLENGLSYTFTVQAVNAVGASSAASLAGSVTPGVPSQMSAPTSTIGSHEVTLHWTPPYNGNVPLNGYIVTVTGLTPSAAPFTVTASPTARSIVIGGLTNGARYGFEVAASADNGTGTPSPTTVAVPAAPPSSPTGVSGSAGHLRVTVRWKAPTSDGGSPVTEYKVTSSPGARTCITRTLSCVVAGLTAGHGYTFRVVAVNASGQSAPSAPSKRVTPT